MSSEKLLEKLEKFTLAEIQKHISRLEQTATGEIFDIFFTLVQQTPLP